jgi:nucleoside triphosphate diphosphatase
MPPSSEIQRLLEIMVALRTPVTGCPWDLQQNFSSIAPYTIEEAYEVVDAIERNDPLDIKDELGDLLLQVVFHAQMANELNLFSFGDVVDAICTKMIRRHPHVFSAQKDMSPDEVKRIWSDIKDAEKRQKKEDRGALGLSSETPKSLLDDIPTALPGLTRAVKLQDKASKVGFDWNDPREVLKKIREELDEVEDALNRHAQAALAAELGDVLFAMANLARHLKVDPESAVRLTNMKFKRRFNFIEQFLASEGRNLEEASLFEMEGLWIKAKEAEGA